MENLKQAVKNITGYTFEGLKSEDKNRDIVNIRYIFIYHLSKIIKNATNGRIAGIMGKKQHGTIINAFKRYNAYYSTELDFRKLADAIWMEYLFLSKQAKYEEFNGWGYIGNDGTIESIYKDNSHNPRANVAVKVTVLY